MQKIIVAFSPLRSKNCKQTYIHGSHVLELRIEMNVCMFLVSSSGKAGLNGESKHDLCSAGEVLCQSSYKANFMWDPDRYI